MRWGCGAPLAPWRFCRLHSGSPNHGIRPTRAVLLELSSHTGAPRGFGPDWARELHTVPLQSSLASGPRRSYGCAWTCVRGPVQFGPHGLPVSQCLRLALSLPAGVDRSSGARAAFPAPGSSSSLRPKLGPHLCTVPFRNPLTCDPRLVRGSPWADPRSLVPFGARELPVLHRLRPVLGLPTVVIGSSFTRVVLSTHGSFSWPRPELGFRVSCCSTPELSDEWPAPWSWLPLGMPPGPGAVQSSRTTGPRRLRPVLRPASCYDQELLSTRGPFSARELLVASAQTGPTT